MNPCVRHGCAGTFSLRCTCRTGRILVSCVFYRRDRMFIARFESRIRKSERAQAARAHPFPLGRKRKQKGPFCTALRQRKDGGTLKTVRRTFPNSAAHAASDTWEGSFLPYGQKSPHEPRSQILRALPRPSESFLSRRQLAAQVICVEPYFSHRKLLRDRSIGPRCTSHALLSSA